ncbi:MAG: penicillin-binding protein 2 [Proteobacteria bacterium]|nr:penicillin-binding protein 2 [Pseudomonadota bacterium]
MTKFIRTTDSEWFRLRLSVVMSLVTAAFIVLLLRLFYLQILEGEEFRRLSENNCIRLQTIQSQRGFVFDRNGALLVDNRPSFNLSIILNDAKPIESIIGILSQYLNIPAEELMAKVRNIKGASSFRPVLLKQDIGRDALALVEAHKYDLPGISVDVRPRRYYLHRHSTAHLIGYLSEINSSELKGEKYPEYKPGDFVGRFGIEREFEKYLKGKRGGRQVEVNVAGQVVRVLENIDAEPGNNIYLTIDQRLQRKVEELLKDRAGAVIAMEPSSGQILAMASNPAFDPNGFVYGLTHDEWKDLISQPNRPMENKAVKGEYPPASTYKIVTAIAALEEKIIDVNTSFYCPGYIKYGNREFRCWKKGGHGSVNVVRALAESCDVFFYNVGLRLDIDKLAWYAKGCGLGTPTGIGLEQEGKGLVPSAIWKKKRFGSSWSSGETLSAVIGQGYNLATPVQMLVLTSAIANGGKRVKPYVMKRIETPGGQNILNGETETVGNLPASQNTLDIVKKGLWEVVNKDYGTAWIARPGGGIELSGKTGTAQIVGRKENETSYERKLPDHFKPHAWFVSYAPSSDPKIAISVIIEHGGHGSSAAGPVARELVKCYLNPEAGIDDNDPEQKAVSDAVNDEY